MEARISATEYFELIVSLRWKMGRVDIAGFAVRFTATQIHIPAKEGRESAIEAFGDRIARVNTATRTLFVSERFILRSLLLGGVGSSLGLAQRDDQLQG